MRIASSVLLLALLAGCSRAPTGLAAELPGSTWSLERIVYADGSIARGAGDEVTFAPDGALTLSSCNTCTGRFRLRRDELRVEEGLACTKMACPVDRVELEQHLAGEHLVLRDGPYLVVEPRGEGAEAEQLLFLPKVR